MEPVTSPQEGHLSSPFNQSQVLSLSSGGERKSEARRNRSLEKPSILPVSIRQLSLHVRRPEGFPRLRQLVQLHNEAHFPLLSASPSLAKRALLLALTLPGQGHLLDGRLGTGCLEEPEGPLIPTWVGLSKQGWAGPRKKDFL